MLVSDGKKMDQETISRRVKELDDNLGWYQNIDLKCGIQTKTRTVWGEEIDHPRQRWESIAPGFPSDFSGKTVLDVGCNAGYFSFVAADRGASRIVALDYKQGYIDQAQFCNEVRGDKIDFRVGNVLDIEKLNQDFDITICIGLLYHVQDIVGAIRAIAKVTRELAIVESAVHPGNNDRPLVYVPSGKGREPGTWHPNMTALKYMFEKEGFSRTQDIFTRGGRGGILAFK